MPSVSASTPTPATLERRLGPLDAAAIIVSNVIGGGIFIVPVILAQMTPNPWAILSVWAVGGLLAFTGAMAYAELAALRPRSGGEYVYLREAFGPLAAFLTGWTSLVAGFSGAVAASSVGMAVYLGRFIPAAGDSTPFLTVPLIIVTLSISPQSVIAIVAIVVLSVIHIRGLGPGRLVQNLLAGLKITALLVFVALGFSFGSGAAANFSVGGGVAPTAWVLALIPVMFSYSGWNAAAYVAEEIREPSRNVPLALGIGTIAVVVIYLLLNLLFVYALPVTELGALDIGVRVVDIAAERLFGSAVAGVLALASVVMIAASVSAMVLAGPRVYFAMAQHGLFFRAAARVHPRFRTPAVAIIAQGLWSCLLVLSGTFSQLIDYTGFAVVLFTGVAVMALFVLRRRLPSEPRPFKAWGYPAAPFVYAVGSMLIVANAIWRNPGPSGAGLLVIGAGIPIYFAFRHWNRGRAHDRDAGPAA